MQTSRKKSIIDDYEFTNWLIHNHVEDISDDESLLQLPFEANCLNWILGHIISRRNSALETLGQPAIWDEETMAKYRTGSPPIRSKEQAMSLSALIADLDRTHDLIDSALTDMNDNELNQMVKNDRGEKTSLDHLKGFHWHETYHLGQLDILRAFIFAEREKHKLKSR